MCVSEDPDRIINTMNMPWAKYQGIVVQCLAGARGSNGLQKSTILLLNGN